MERLFGKGFQLRLGSSLQNRGKCIARYWLHLFPSLFEWLEVFFRSLHRPNFIMRREHLELEKQSCYSIHFTFEANR
jgi:hypothetical protein